MSKFLTHFLPSFPKSANGKEMLQLTIIMPTDDVPALLVAISNHAHRFLMDAQRERKNIERVKTWPERSEVQKVKKEAAIALMEEDEALWTHKGEVLNAVKAELKRQAGIK